MNDGHYDVGLHTIRDVRHCDKCGEELLIEQRNTGTFSKVYGVPNKQERRVCPQHQRWLDGHMRTGWVSMSYIGPRPAPTRDPRPTRPDPVSPRSW